MQIVFAEMPLAQPLLCGLIATRDKQLNCFQPVWLAKEA